MSRNGGGSGGLQSIPQGSRKVVQSLKEIVNCPEAEIYGMLKECNMDPNEAVNRLLSQDPFHEVKSKREKKKENKDSVDSRSRGVSTSSNRNTWNGADRYSGRGGSTPFGSFEPGILHAKFTQRKDNGTNVSPSSLHSTSIATGYGTAHNSSALSDSKRENKVSTKDVADGISPASQTTVYQPTLSGFTGQPSMADIVKMGRQHSKTASPPHSSHNHKHAQTPSSATLYPELHSLEDHGLNASQIHPEAGIASVQNFSLTKLWHPVEPQPTTNLPSILEPSTNSEVDKDPSRESFDKINEQTCCQIDDDWTVEDSTNDNSRALHDGTTSLSIRELHHDIDWSANDSSVSVSSVTANLQQLNFLKEDPEVQGVEGGPSVVIPDHLQVQTAECSHLSFGNLDPRISGPILSRLPKASSKEAALELDASTAARTEPVCLDDGRRTSEYYGDEPRRTSSDGDLARKTFVNGCQYDLLPVSQPEALQQEDSEMFHRNEYALVSSSADQSFENEQQLNITFSQSQTSSQIQNLVPFSNAEQTYSNSQPTGLLASNSRLVGDSVHPYSIFSINQSMPTKYGDIMSSIESSAISVPEALKTTGFPSGQHTQHIMSGTNNVSGGLQEHTMNPYFQPTLPLGPVANLMYPLLPQSYSYMPSAYQNSFIGNSTYQQSLAALLPQYKNNVAVSNLPQSATMASGYGAFGSSAIIPGNFAANPAPTAAGTTIGRDDSIGSQYKDNSRLLSLVQNQNLATWLHGAGSQTMSGIPPGNTYHGFPGQNQQPAGIRQGQQPSQAYGATEFSNIYDSQAGMSLEQQQYHYLRDRVRGGYQGQPQQSHQQLWQNNY